jgi:hypothetical protein
MTHTLALESGIAITARLAATSPTCKTLHVKEPIRNDTLHLDRRI